MIVDLTGFSTGICDRLRQVTFCAVIANLNSDKCLEIYEISTAEGPFKIVDLLTIDGFEIKTLGEAPKISLKMTPQTSEICTATVRLYKPKNLNISDDEFLTHWKAIFKRIKPLINEESLNKKILANGISRGSIGIHIRLSDRLSKYPAIGSITEKQYNNFVKHKIPKIIKYAKSKNYSVFLATDNIASDKTIREILNRELVVTEYRKKWESVGVRNTDGDTFMRDLFGLSNCREIYCTTGGGVPTTAALIGGIAKDSVHIWTEEGLLNNAILLVRSMIIYSRISFALKFFSRSILALHKWTF